jgi:hypothetical protein
MPIHSTLGPMPYNKKKYKQRKFSTFNVPWFIKLGYRIAQSNSLYNHEFLWLPSIKQEVPLP